MNIFRMPVKRW